MVGHYGLGGFVRQAANCHLARYLSDRGIDLGLDFEAQKARNSEPIFEAILGLDDEIRSAIDRDFQSIASLGEPAGLHQIRDEAKARGVDLEAGLQHQRSLLNKAFWTFLHDPLVFEGALRFAVPHLAGRYWKRGLPVTSAPGIELIDRVEALERAVSRYFLKEEGRGKACKIDYDLRRPLHKFHAYPEDYPAAPLVWSSTGLAPQRLRPAFEVVFVYDEEEGSLDVYFEGARAGVERLWQLFAETVLGLVDLPLQARPAFSLERLKSRSFSFVRPPDSRIVDVRIKRLNLTVFSHCLTTISVGCDDSQDRMAVRHLLRSAYRPIWIG